MALAWPLRVLQETNQPELISDLLNDATNLVANVTPNSSRASAIVLLVQAVIPAGLSYAEPAILQLLAIRNDEHWRVLRVFC